MAEKRIQLGQVDVSDAVGATLHKAAYGGSKRTLQKVLARGINVDYPNSKGQSPLFCACLLKKENAVECLLANGANPNERCNDGLTPVHAASYIGCVKIIMKLLTAGGDLRLHDNNGLSVRDWAMINEKPKPRLKMLEFLDKVRLFAMSSCGQDLLANKSSSQSVSRANRRRSTVTQLIREKMGRSSVDFTLQKIAVDNKSIGYGQAYQKMSNSSIPLVCENDLRHDFKGETYNNGAFFVMESMSWNDAVNVTIKRLHRDIDAFQGGVVDLLINEAAHIGKLRHPQILILMGVCQTTQLDSMVLIFERIGQGSLYNFLHHQQVFHPSAEMISDIAKQMCSAIVFIHSQGYIHSAITSHAVSMIDCHSFKLGNFEYMVESSKCSQNKKTAVTSHTAENSVYNWMAPEVMNGQSPSVSSDMFSYCVMIWEMFHGDVPWDNLCFETVKQQYNKNKGLNVQNGNIPEYFEVILSYGLRLDAAGRKLTFLHVNDLVNAAPTNAKMYLRTHLRHLEQPGSSPSSSSPLGKKKAKGHNNNSPSKLLNRKSQKLKKEAILGKLTRQKSKKEAVTDEQAPPKPIRQAPYSTEGFQWEVGPDVDNKDVKQDEGKEESKRSPRRWHRSPIKPPWTPADKQFNDSEKKTRHMSGQSDKHRSPVRPAQSSCLNNTEGMTSPGKPEDVGDDITPNVSGSELRRRKSLMGGFSYLTINSRHQRTRSAGIKPATHVQSDTVPDQFSTAGKLTSAGSLWALYNDHRIGLPGGQLQPSNKPRICCTLPRKTQVKQWAELDPSVLPCAGSVKDLVKTFQQQIQQHGYHQSILEGKLATGNADNDTELDGLKHVSGDGWQDGHKESINTDSPSEVGGESVQKPESVIASSSRTSFLPSSASLDSNWLDQEFSRIQQEMSKEVEEVEEKDEVVHLQRAETSDDSQHVPFNNRYRLAYDDGSSVASSKLGSELHKDTSSSRSVSTDAPLQCTSSQFSMPSSSEKSPTDTESYPQLVSSSGSSIHRDKEYLSSSHSIDSEIVSGIVTDTLGKITQQLSSPTRGTSQADVPDKIDVIGVQRSRDDLKRTDCVGKTEEEKDSASFQLEEAYFEDEIFAARDRPTRSDWCQKWVETSPSALPMDTVMIKTNPQYEHESDPTPQCGSRSISYDHSRSSHTSGSRGNKRRLEESKLRKVDSSKNRGNKSAAGGVLKSKHANKSKSLGTSSSKLAYSNVSKSANDPRRSTGKLSRIPTSRSDLTLKSKSDEAAYQATMTVTSSRRDNTGIHHITHKVKDLATGDTTTYQDSTYKSDKLTAAIRFAQTSTSGSLTWPSK